VSPPFELLLSDEAQALVEEMEGDSSQANKLRKVRGALGKLETQGSAYPGLNSHQYSSIEGVNGEDVWESCVENQTPSAWRHFWAYGPNPGQITFVTLGPHPWGAIVQTVLTQSLTNWTCVVSGEPSPRPLKPLPSLSRPYM
jgi:hypothetical protein